MPSLSEVSLVEVETSTRNVFVYLISFTSPVADMELLVSLLEQPGSPGLIHLHHPHHPPSALRIELPSRCAVARLDAIEHHTQRLLYAGILSRLAVALGKRDTNSERQAGDDGREVITWDAFVRSLRALWTQHVGKGKGKATGEEGQVVIIITKAERLRSVMGSSWTALTRLPELVSFPLFDAS